MRSLLLSLALALNLIPFGRTVAQPRKIEGPARRLTTPDTIPQFYSIIACGTAQNDSTIPFPQPIVFLQILDTTKYKLAIRFPHLGLIGLIEDTLYDPTLTTSKQGLAYCAVHPLMQLRFPEMDYEFWIDIIDRKQEKVVASRLMPYKMEVENYKKAAVRFLHPATAGMGSPMLRRAFRPRLLPLMLEANAGWETVESLDSSGIYALRFRNSADTNLEFMTITATPAEPEPLDSTSWENFKLKAREAFGKKGIPVKSIGDFEVTNKRARNILERCYEFVIRQQDSSYDYVAAYRTPYDIILLVAPLNPEFGKSSLDYFEIIARSFKLTADNIAGRKPASIQLSK